MNLQIAAIVERADVPVTVLPYLRLDVQTVTNLQTAAPLILIQIALQLPAAVSQHHIHRHRLWFL